MQEIKGNREAVDREWNWRRGVARVQVCDIFHISSVLYSLCFTYFYYYFKSQVPWRWSANSDKPLAKNSIYMKGNFFILYFILLHWTARIHITSTRHQCLHTFSCIFCTHLEGEVHFHICLVRFYTRHAYVWFLSFAEKIVMLNAISALSQQNYSIICCFWILFASIYLNHNRIQTKDFLAAIDP